MPQIEHNAPKFKYRIYWKLDKAGERWKIEDIADWRLKELVIALTGYEKLGHGFSLTKLCLKGSYST